MLWTFAVILLIFWLLGFVSGYMVDDFIHVPLFVAIIAMLIQVEQDCGDEDSGPERPGYLKRQAVRRAGKILSTLATPAGEKEGIR